MIIGYHSANYIPTYPGWNPTWLIMSKRTEELSCGYLFYVTFLFINFSYLLGCHLQVNNLALPAPLVLNATSRQGYSGDGIASTIA